MTDNSWQQRDGFKIQRAAGTAEVQLDRALNGAEVLPLLVALENDNVWGLRVGREMVFPSEELRAWKYFHVAYSLAVSRLQTPWIAVPHATFCGVLAYRWYVRVERVFGCPPLSGLPLTFALLENERLRECFELGFRMELTARRHCDLLQRICPSFEPEDLRILRRAILRLREELAGWQGTAPPTLQRARTWAWGARLRAFVARAIGQHSD